MYIDCIVAGFVWYIVPRMFFYKGNNFVGVNGGGGGVGVMETKRITVPAFLQRTWQV